MRMPTPKFLLIGLTGLMMTACSTTSAEAQEAVLYENPEAERQSQAAAQSASQPPSPDTNAAAGEIVKIDLVGEFQQGGLVYGRAPVGAKIFLDGEQILTSEDGRFVIGFDRDQAKMATVAAEYVGGAREEEVVQVKSRDWKKSYITLPKDQPVKPSEFTKDQLTHIARSTAKKKAARAHWTKTDHWKNGFAWPIAYWDVEKGRLSSPFGSQRFYNGVPKRYHSGMDIAAVKGTPIKAPADGLVMLADENMFFEGGLVLVDHGLKLESAFMHMSKINVKAGDVIKQGDIIGEVGATGRATGPHLHWGLKWRNHKLDPRRLMPEPGIRKAAIAEE